ncbi:MAG: peptidylprolyl isomerase [Puniceicoccales bacterium]|jgi:peptidyl-prolyl cis-trans isomerase SurA|nr:peptidylprolyl isomerase [Puniceicoccales bacterium]
MRTFALASALLIPITLSAQFLPGTAPQQPSSRIPTAIERPQLTPEEIRNREWRHFNQDQIRVNVDGEVITRFDILRGFGFRLAQARQEASSTEEFNRAMHASEVENVENLTNQKLMIAEFKERGASVPPSIVSAQIDDIIERNFNGDRAEYLNYLKRSGSNILEAKRDAEESVIVNWMRTDTLKSANDISPKKIQEYYDENKQRYHQNESVKFRQITLYAAASETEEDVRRKANLIMDAVRQGTDFGELAKRYSVDDYRTEGGDAGWKEVSGLNEKIVEALKNLPNKGVTEPMNFSQPGGRLVLFILQKEDYRNGGPLPLEEVQDEIAMQLVFDDRKVTQQDFIERLRKKFFVRYY